MEEGGERVPRLVAFDLDGTVWLPEMYQMWGSGGPPFEGNGMDSLTDRSGREVRLLGCVREVLTLLHNDPKWQDTKVAWVSCTDEPEWAQILLRKFQIHTGQSIGAVAHSSQIFQANKREHFKQLKRQFEDIAFEEMVFFDNEYGNIRSVQHLGVHCVHCPDGVTQEIWNEALSLYSRRG